MPTLCTHLKALPYACKIMHVHMVTGIVLAGGYSSRAKVNKLLLKVDRKPLIYHTINSLKPFVDKIVVVTGRYDKELRPYLDDVTVIYNKDYDLGMFSSVKTGLTLVNDECLIIPGDIAYVNHKTIESILKQKGCISIPTYKGERGHPLFLNKDMVELLKKEDMNSNLRKFIKKHEDKVNLIEVDDPFINFDIDTIEDYNRFLFERKVITYEG